MTKVLNNESFIAGRLLRTQTSATAEITDRASALETAGRDVITLSVGEPDFATSEHIKEAAHTALRKDMTKYTVLDGTAELKKAVQDKFLRENGLSYGLDQIIVTNGGKQAIFNALLATLNPGDEVIIPAPFWVSYPEMVTIGGGTPIVVPCDKKDFKLCPSDLEKAITEKTKWLILNSPNNPTGAVYTREELKALADVLLRHPQIHILADDIYEHILYEGEKFFTLAEVEPQLTDRTLVVNGLSKAFAMTGWRVGYAAGPRKIIQAMKSVQSHSTSNICSISQAAAVAALNGSQDFRKEWIKSYRKRRDLVVKSLNATKGLTCQNPSGAFYVFPECSGVIGKKTFRGHLIANDQDFALQLLEDEGVAIVRGALSVFHHISVFLTQRPGQCLKKPAYG